MEATEMIGLAEDRDRWRAFVSVAMSLRVPYNAGKFSTLRKHVRF